MAGLFVWVVRLTVGFLGNGRLSSWFIPLKVLLVVLLSASFSGVTDFAMLLM